MKRFTSILCSTLFAIFGIGLAISTLDSATFSNAQTISAGTIQSLPDFDIPAQTAVVDYSSMPLDLQLDQAKKASVDVGITTAETESAKIDSLNKVIAKLEQTKQVTKVKWRTGPAPPPIVKTRVVEKTITDTVRVPVYYLATVEKKEDSTGQCIPVYEVRKVNEICPEITNSSSGYVNERASGVGD